MGRTKHTIVTNTSIKARQLLSEALITLSTAGSFWYNITGDQTLLCALMLRLGFESKFEWYSFLSSANLAEYNPSRRGGMRLKIKIDEWQDFLSERGGYGLSCELFTIKSNNLDLASFAEGTAQDGERNHIYTLRIGHKDENYRDKFTAQVGANVLLDYLAMLTNSSPL